MAMNRMRNGQKGLTLIELLVVLAIIGILAAMAIVNYLVALDKSKQKKTMGDMRSIASAWEARAIDRGGYSAAGQSPAYAWPSEQIDDADLELLLSPTYIRPMARADGWGFPFQYAVETTAGASVQSAIYGIRSAGRDGQFESSYPDKTTSRFDCDIVFSNGQFVVMPENR